MRLLLLRHAKADRPAGDDFDRPLAKRGREAAGAVGERLAAEGWLPDLVLVSSARRTRETVERVLAAAGIAPPVRAEDRLYDATSDAVLDVLHETEGACVLLVGHNPGIHETALRLAGRGDSGRLRQGFPTAALAVLDVPGDDPAAFVDGAATLTRLVLPRDGDD